MEGLPWERTELLSVIRHRGEHPVACLLACKVCAVAPAGGTTAGQCPQSSAVLHSVCDLIEKAAMSVSCTPFPRYVGEGADQ